MTLEQFKQEVEKRTGIPTHLLNGETQEEVVAQARAIGAYVRDSQASAQLQPQQKKTTAEQFSDWFDAQVNPAAAMMYGSGSAPAGSDAQPSLQGVPNPGEPYLTGPQEQRSAADSFSDWLDKTLGYDF